MAACSTSSAKTNGERPCSSLSQEPSPHPTRKADHETQDARGARDGRQRGGQEIAARDTNRAIAGFYFHRLLCRVFSDPDSPFVLKGGQSVLARTVDARATRDIDLLARETSVEAAVADLRRLAGIGLDDFISFSFDKAEPIKADDEYRSGMKVWFAPLSRWQVPASRVRRPRGRRGRRRGARHGKCGRAGGEAP
ncbi:nucleotidyl transferase AbiEii/AbiGii toxin family protein [Ellagibacter isourolithinifaciens]|uniref:nucleotidyl transferase AbiEii/AbiGii toxin family protein n=1 Tax=Ellagibacter isourolithinifaciens TaxID=2137581 RepID=UPI003A8CF384